MPPATTRERFRANALAKGISPNVEAAMRQNGELLDNEGNVEALDAIRFHTLEFTNGAPITANAENRFFSVGPTDMVCNTTAPYELVKSGRFKAEALAFGIEVIGDDEAAADLTAFDIAKTLAKVIRGGHIQLKVRNNAKYECYGLFNHPSGGGPVLNAAAATTASTTSAEAAVVTNGLQAPSAIRRFKHPFTFNQSSQVMVLLRYRDTITPPSGLTVRITANLIGEVLDDVGVV